MQPSDELINSIMPMARIKATLLATKIEAETSAKPFQLTEEPRELKLDEAKPNTNTKKTKMTPPPLLT